MRADLLAFVFQLHLARHRRNRSVNIGDARDNPVFSGYQLAAFSVRDDRFHYADWKALRDARVFVNALIVSGLESNLFDRFANEVGNQETILKAIARGPGFLSSDLDAQLKLFWIMRHDLGADAIFERRYDLAARRVVFRVCRKDQHHIQRQTHRITFNLHVAFLHDVEKTDLNFAGEIGKFINRKDAAIRAR